MCRQLGMNGKYMAEQSADSTKTETQNMEAAERRRLNVVMRWLRSMCGVLHMRNHTFVGLGITYMWDPTKVCPWTNYIHDIDKYYRCVIY